MGQALLLGAIQGPTEALPISSSGHLALVPALLDWPYARLDPRIRKSFEVALHAAGAVGLILSLGRGAVGLGAGAPVRACRRVALTSAPVALAGLVLRGPIERRLGSGPSVAAAQVVAGAALWASDLRPSRRGVAKVRPADEIAIGLAQALALAPGVSRAGTTLTAARLLGFDRRSSARLSRQASLPVIVGASLLEALSIAEDRPPRRLGRPFAAGATAALISTIASRPLLRAVERRWPYRALAAYRVALGAFALERLSASDRGRAPAPGGGNRGAALAVASD